MSASAKWAKAIRGLFFTCAAIASVPVSAAVSNPETFESYGTGTTPNAAAGWVLTDGNLLDKTVQAGGPTGKFLRLRSTYADSSTSMWTMSSTSIGGVAGAGPVVTIKADVRFAANPTDNSLSLFGITAMTSGATYHNHFLSFFYSHTYSPNLLANNNGSGTYSSDQPLPGDVSTGNIGNWFTIEMELNYTANTVRERWGPQGGPMHAFTSTAPIGVLSENEFIQIGFTGLRGTVDLDNLSVSVVPEPTLGGAMLLSVIAGLRGVARSQRRS